MRRSCGCGGRVIAGAYVHADRCERDVGVYGNELTLAAILSRATIAAYRAALARHGGDISKVATELAVHRVTASRAVERLGPVEVDGTTYATLRAWLNAAYPHRDPATVGRRGDTRKQIKWASPAKIPLAKR